MTNQLDLLRPRYFVAIIFDDGRRNESRGYHDYDFAVNVAIAHIQKKAPEYPVAYVTVNEYLDNGTPVQVRKIDA